MPWGGIKGMLGVSSSGMAFIMAAHGGAGKGGGGGIWSTKALSL